MTGNDDGGFSPHPGDPWHPAWTPDSEPDEESLSADAGDGFDEEAEPSPRRRLFGRRSKDRDPDDAAAPEPTEEREQEPSVEPAIAAESEIGKIGEPDDPFDAVLRAEGRSVRRRPADPDDAPAPDWTADEETPGDLTLPVSPPSWVGDSTATDPAIEASGFDPVTSPAEEPEQPDLFGSHAEDLPDDGPDSTPEFEVDAGLEVDAGPDVDGDADAGADVDSEPELVGEYGVAGAEAFDELTEDTEEDLGDWAAFMEGAAAVTDEPEPAPEPIEVAGPAEPLGDADDFDDWVESQPKQKRRSFRRRRSEPAAEEVWDDEWQADSTAADDLTAVMPIPDGSEHAVEDPDAAVAEALAALGAVDADRGVVEDEFEDADADVWSAADDPGGWVDEDDDELLPTVEIADLVEPGVAVDPAAAEPVDVDELLGTGAMAEEPEGDATDVDQPVATEPVDVDDLLGTSQIPDELEGDAVDVVADADETVAVADSVDLVDEPVVDESIEDFPEAVGADEGFLITGTTDEVDELSAEEPASMEDEAPVDVDEPIGAMEPADAIDGAVEEPADWEGDPSQVPSSWFADVDEDTVVPPVPADTPETEWPADEGPWEGRAAWEEESSTEVFDVEAEPAPADPDSEPEPVYEAGVAPIVPEGYEDWGAVVAEATADVGEETAEYHVQHVPPPEQGLPEGFEQFPEPGAAVLYGDGSAHPEDATMRRDDTFDETPVAYLDEAPDEPLDFDEQIYVGGGTVEHRGLAEAIAAVGEDDDTEWQAMSAAIPGVESGVLGFEDVADLASGDEYVAPVRSNLGMRVLTGVVLAGMLVGSLFVGGWAFALFVGAIVLLGLGELYATLSRQGYLPLTLFGLVGGAGTLAATWFHGPVAIPAGVMLTAVAVFFFYAFAPTRRDALTNGGVTLLGLAWAVGGVAFAIPIARGAEFEVLVLAAVVCTAAMDIGAFSVGRRFGRRRLAPVLSPNKTVEGFAGGALAAFIVAGAVGYLELGPFDMMSGLALGAIVVVMAPLGDLAESMIKRSMGVKDMGSTLPGHGGVLDRIDALVFVIPAAWVLFEVLGYLA
jgi:phosphatidate cytidylyltransferase